MPVGGHEHFDVAARVETVELGHDLEHRALHLVVTTGAIIEASACCSVEAESHARLGIGGTSNGVDFVKEDDARLLAARHLE